MIRRLQISFEQTQMPNKLWISLANYYLLYKDLGLSEESLKALYDILVKNQYVLSGSDYENSLLDKLVSKGIKH